MPARAMSLSQFPHDVVVLYRILTIVLNRGELVERKIKLLNVD